MYKLSVPIMSATVTPANREIYAKQCREAGVERIFLVIGSAIMQPIPDRLAENVSYFKSCGFEVGVWTDTIGHGFVLTHVENDDQSDFEPIVDIAGRVRSHTNCPLDPSFRSHIASFVEKLSVLAEKANTKVVMSISADQSEVPDRLKGITEQI